MELLTIPITDHLRSNTVLSNAEEQLVQSKLPTLEADIYRMATEIEQLQSTLEKLIHEHRKKSDFVSSYHALIAPIRRLPPEVLQNIFVNCLPDQEFVQPDPSCAPLLLGKVCSYWRTISMHTPRLWSSISIPPTWSGRNGATLIDLWLSRSCDIPISLELFRVPSYHKDICARYRCRKMKIPLYILAHDSFAKSFTLLEEIVITGRVNMTRPSLTVACPMIRRAELLDIDLSSGVSDLLPWSQLTYLKFSCCTSQSALLSFLSRCCNLEKLSFSFSRRVDPGSIETPRRAEPLSSVVLEIFPKLHSWTVHIGWARPPVNGFMEFLDGMIMPSLCKFKFSSTYDYWLDVRPKILSLIFRSSCPLERLEILLYTGQDVVITLFPEKDMVELVQSCLTLRTLVVSCEGRDMVYPSVAELLAGRNP